MTRRRASRFSSLVAVALGTGLSGWVISWRSAPIGGGWIPFSHSTQSHVPTRKTMPPLGNTPAGPARTFGPVLCAAHRRSAHPESTSRESERINPPQSTITFSWYCRPDALPDPGSTQTGPGEPGPTGPEGAAGKNAECSWRQTTRPALTFVLHFHWGFRWGPPPSRERPPCLPPPEIKEQQGREPP